MANAHQRFSALDGLRGLAVLAVIVNHVPLLIWNAQAPSWLGPFLAIPQASGKTGVTLLFMLTGFLMSWLYPQPTSALKFWSRRYARLFPPFLTMVAAWAFIEAFPGLPVLKQLLIVLACAGVARLLWEIGLKIAEYIPLKKWLLVAFLVFQAGMAVWYVWGLQRVPAAVFYTVWQPWLQKLTSALINASLTLPFGQYIAQLDGVYWSLVAEVGFYLLYPTLIVPLIQVVKHDKSQKHKVLLAISVFPFFIALKYISEHLLGMSLLIPQLTIFFVAGVLIGQFRSELYQWLKTLPKFWKSAGATQLLTAIVASHVVAYSWLPADWHVTWQLLTVVPMSMLLLLLTTPELSEAKWLTNRSLLWLGKYSFSLYLTHSLVVRWLEKIIPPTSIANSFILTGVVIVGSCALSWALYQLIEAPYFNLRKKKVVSVEVIKPKVEKTLPLRPAVAWMFCLVMLAIVYIAYRPPVALFTMVSRVGVNWPFSLWQPAAPIKLSPTPTVVRFVSPENQLGVVMTSIKSRRLEDNPDIDAAPWELRYVLSKDGQIVGEKSFLVHELGSNLHHPFGFALQSDSKDQTYEVAMSVDRINRSFEAKFLQEEGQALIVNFFDKKTLLKQPVLLAKWAVAKILEPLANPAFWRTILLVGPTLILLLMASKSVKKPLSS